MQDRIFYITCFGFIFGVLVRSFVPTSVGVGIPTLLGVGIFYIVILFGVISIALFLFYFFISRNNWGILAAIFIFTFCLGVFRFHIADKPAPTAISMSGEIADEPSIGENNQKLMVQTGETKILITTGFDNEYKYGDEISFTGKLAKPGNFITDQGKVFDYVNYLRKDGILYVMSYPKIQIVSRGNGNIIKNALFSAKEKFLEKMNFAITEPESLLMGGLILGEKSSFSQALRQSFVNTGTIHIVALSGYNVTIVAEWFMKLFSLIPFVPKNFGIGMGILAVLLFIMMTGGSSTAIRAGIMATLALIARATGRNYDVARALLLAAVFMILLNPFVLAYDVSFQLSFLATVAVIFLTPRIEKYFLWVPERFKLRDIISITVAAYIFVFPFILYKMGNFSLVALPANILILPFIPLTMMLGFITGFAGFVWYGFGVPFGYISYLFLHYELGVISFFSNLPFAAFTFPDFPLFLTLTIYAYFIYRLFGRNIKEFFLARP